MKKLIALMMSIIFSVAMLVGCAPGENQGNQTPPPPPPDTDAEFVSPYDTMEIGTVGLGVWASPPQGFTNEAGYKQIADCGMNFVEGFRYNQGSVDVIKKALTLCGDLGLKFLPNDSDVLLPIINYIKDKDDKHIKEAIDAIGEYYDYPAYAGQLLVDEPWATDFAAIDKFIKAFDKQYPGNAWIVNMFPGVDFGYNSSTNTYEGYVDDWLNSNQKLYSFDYYPLLVNNTEPPTYFYNLDMLRAKTREKEIPFWSFVQACSYSGKREPSENDMRWNLFANLAFGVKNVQYFTYWTVGGVEAYGEGLIDTDGNPTVRYNYVKEAHAEVAAYGDKLMRAHSDGIMLHGQSSTGQNLYSENLTEFGYVKGIESDDCVVAGCFSDVETDAKSMLFMADTPRDDISLKLKLDSSVKTVTVYTNGVKKIVTVAGAELQLDIPAGDAIYIEF